ncbi:MULTISPECIES: dihydropteroate synthase [Rhodobacterales]|uniref:dihydropteroate synthase n=1 Tax=Rhodobacterales TaxID=204455 RepID=UPI0015F09248|nr:MULTISPECIES: dihydropteroate synthase [Rhodobacterales]MDO6589050.1 dihydropteroate synthase [Yoonia sp. 1_MG-2023]
MIYYQPVMRMGADRAPGAYQLAGGACWFDQAILRQRGQTDQWIAADDIPAEILSRLTRPHTPIAGMAMTRPHLMGILNVTPDSFSDGGQFTGADVALSHALAMAQAGASIIDIGGESTRPGADTVAAHVEIARTAPVIAAIRACSDVPISIDTRKAPVASAAINAGANLVNDVAALGYDAETAQVVAQSSAPVCLMHAQGAPATMQQDPRYDDVLLDVYDYLAQRIDHAVAAGIARDRIVVDPGIGFGKTLDHNLALLRGLSLFHALGCPVLLGASRKKFIGTLSGGQDAADRVSGSVAVALHGARQGVQLLRVHDISATKQALDLDWAINGAV